MPLIYDSLLGSDPRNALLLGGGLMIAGAIATLFVDAGRPIAKGLQVAR
jgi:maltose/moltooligosaccharide transporter